MKLRSRIAVALVFAALPILAQTAAEQLQKGIFAQESQGKTDEAITIYRQLANSTLTPREIAAQAQYRLSQSLLQKGDIATATREMERLERDFPEYGKLISSLAAQKGVHVTPQDGPPRSPQYNEASIFSVQGKVQQVFWVNPTSWLSLDSNGKKYWVELASPNRMYQAGMTRTTIKLNDVLLVLGSGTTDGTPALRATTVKAADGTILYDRAKLPPPLSPEEMRRIEETIAKEAAAKAQQGK